jgi:hypothetical protein
MEERGDRRWPRFFQEKEDGFPAGRGGEGCEDRSGAVFSLGGGGIRLPIFWTRVLRFLRLMGLRFLYEK